MVDSGVLSYRWRSAIAVFVAAVAAMLLLVLASLAAEGQAAAAIKPVSCVTSTVESAAEVAFEPAADDNAARYLLYRSENSGDWQWTDSIAVAGGSTFSHAQDPNVVYTYAVKTRGIDDDFTALTRCGGAEPVVIGPGIAPASCVAADPVEGLADITFVAAANDNAARYLLYRSEDVGASWLWSGSIIATAEPVVSFAESAGTRYLYGVKTRGTDDTFTPLTRCAEANAPAAPVACVSVIRTDTTVETSLSRPGPLAESVKLYRSDDGGPFVAIGSIGGGNQTTDAIASAFTAGDDTSFAFASIGPDGVESQPTPCAGPVPPAPECFSNENRKTVAWEPNGADQYFIFRIPSYVGDGFEKYRVRDALAGNVSHWQTPYQYDYDAFGLSTTEVPHDLDVFQPCRAIRNDVLSTEVESCSSEVIGDRVRVTWTPRADDVGLDRYVIYARTVGTYVDEWQGSVPPSEASFTSAVFDAPANTAWLVKTRATVADGTRVFTDGKVCGGTAVKYLGGDDVADPIPVSGAVSVDASTLFATTEIGENALALAFDIDNKFCYTDPGISVNRSVWYRWTPGATGEFPIEISGQIRGIAVYQPTDSVSQVSELADTMVACTLRSETTVTVTDPDVAYYVQVFGTNVVTRRSGSYSTFGDYTLSIAAAPPIWCGAIDRADDVDVTLIAAPRSLVASHTLYRSVNGGPAAVIGTLAGPDADSGVITVAPYDDSTTLSFTSIMTNGVESKPTVCDPPTPPAPACSSIRSGPNQTVAWEPNGAAQYTLSVELLDRYLSDLETVTDANHVTLRDGRTLYLSTYAPNAQLDRAFVATPDHPFAATVARCDEATPGGLLPVDLVDCTSSVDERRHVRVGWTPATGDTADRYVIYARESSQPSGTWRGSVAPDQLAFTTAGITAPADPHLLRRSHLCGHRRRLCRWRLDRERDCDRRRGHHRRLKRVGNSRDR